MVMLNPLQNPFVPPKALIFSPSNPPTKTTSPFAVSSSKHDDPPPLTKPNQRPRRRGRKSEAEAVEDFVRTALNRAITAVRDADPESIPTDRILKEREEADTSDSDEDEDEDGEEGEVEGGGEGGSTLWRRRARTGLWMRTLGGVFGGRSTLRSIRSGTWSGMTGR